MSTVSRGFLGRRRDGGRQLPPGQYLTDDFPAFRRDPTPRIPLNTWEFTVSTEQGDSFRWSWAELMALPAESVKVDVHCVTRWSKLDTVWRGVSLDTLLGDIETEGGLRVDPQLRGYSTNLPLEGLLDGKSWVAYEYEGEELAPEHGGPARLLVPHLLGHNPTRIRTERFGPTGP